MATFKAVVLKGSGHVKSDGTTNLKIRVTHNRKVEYISTDLYVVPDKSKKGYDLGSNADFITDRLTDYISKYQKKYIALGDLANQMTVQEIKKAVIDEKNNEIDFIEFADSYMKQLEVEGKAGSFRAVRGLISRLKEFSPNLNFSQIDSRFLIHFERHLKLNGVENGIQTYMSRFRVIFNKGREFYNDDDRGIIRIANYPFKKYKIKQPLSNANDYCLSIDQMKILINHNPLTDRGKLAKDMFLLMFCLIGINTKDLFFCKKQDKKDRIRFKRFKTKRDYSIKLEPEALEIISRYKSNKLLINATDLYCDHLHFQTAINIGLKSICSELHDKFNKEAKAKKLKDAKLDFPIKITTNWARHTWATVGRNDCRIDKDDIALCMGHEDEDNKVTDKYIRYDYSIIDESNRKVLNTVFC